MESSEAEPALLQYETLYSIIYMTLGPAKHQREFSAAGKTEDSSMDITFLLYLQQFRQLTSGILDSLFLYITTLGEDWILFLGTAGIYWCILCTLTTIWLTM